MDCHIRNRSERTNSVYLLIECHHNFNQNQLMWSSSSFLSLQFPFFSLLLLHIVDICMVIVDRFEGSSREIARNAVALPWLVCISINLYVMMQMHYGWCTMHTNYRMPAHSLLYSNLSNAKLSQNICFRSEICDFIAFSITVLLDFCVWTGHRYINL